MTKGQKILGKKCIQFIQRTNFLLTKIFENFSGQDISQEFFLDFNYFQKTNETFSPISALDSKKWLNQKEIKVLYFLK